VVRLQDTTLDHVLDSARSTNDDLGALLESLHVITDAGAANTGVALNVHEVSDGNYNLLDLLGKLASGGEDESLAGLDIGVQLLEDGDGEGSRFTGTGLGLRNDIVAWREVSTLRGKQKQREGPGLPLITGMMARCWMAEGRSKP
jgi:hypothetical protein